MKKEFDTLYQSIVDSEDDKKMHVLGTVTKSMMYKFIDAYPQQAREYLDMLQAVKWHNYVTMKEAEEIVAQMTPKPMWSYAKWDQMLTEEKLVPSEEPCYNKYALYVVMCMISSDSGSTISNMLEHNNINADEKKMFEFIHCLALDKLKDVDKKFNIRSYFEL